MCTLPHERLFQAIGQTLTAAQKDGLAPVAVALMSPSGHLVHFARMAGAPDRAGNIAMDKARTAAMMEAPTRAIYARLHKEGLSHADFGGAVTCAITGGLPFYLEGCFMGGIGVSGRTPDDDEQVAELCVTFLQGTIHKKG